MAYTTDLNAELVSKQASKNTKMLFEYLKSIYGKKHLAGQQYLQSEEVEDLVYYHLTGKLPAMRGYDFMGVSSCKKTDDQVDRAIKWATQCGGIVTMCWHWYAPNDMNDYSKGSSFYYKTTGYDHKTCFDLCKGVTEGTAEYEFIIREIDMVSAELKRMAQLDIPVLWRPLHEANGNWFWWGNHDEQHREAYKKLWYMIFDRMENYHKLTNLIWVWNGQDKDWYPGDKYVDIIGEDIYPGEHVYTSQISKYLNAATNYSTGHKLVYMTENGCVFDPELAKRDGAMWGMWCTWQGEFVVKSMSIITLDETYTEEEMLKKAYNDEDVITLEDLPDLKTYPIREGF